MLGEVYSRCTNLEVHAARWNQLQQTEVSPKMKIILFVFLLLLRHQQLESIRKHSKACKINMCAK